MRSFFDLTVWSRNNTNHIPGRYHLLYRLILPVEYISVMLYGLLSIPSSIRSIDRLFGPIYGDLWSTTLAIAGLGALVGVAFYKRLIWLEAASLMMMLSLMVFYLLAIIIGGLIHIDDFRYLSFLQIIVFLPMPGWRASDIVREMRPPRNVS